MQDDNSPGEVDEQGEDGTRTSKDWRKSSSSKRTKRMELMVDDNHNQQLKKYDKIRNIVNRDQDRMIKKNEGLDKTSQKLNKEDLLLGAKIDSNTKKDGKMGKNVFTQKDLYSRMYAEKEEKYSKAIVNKKSSEISLSQLYLAFLNGKLKLDDKITGSSHNTMRNEAIKALNDKFTTTDHNDLIFNITDYLLLATVTLDGGSVYDRVRIYDNQGASKQSDWIPKHYPIGSFGTLPMQQCWTFEIPNMESNRKVNNLRLLFNGSIFQNPDQPGIRPDSFGFEVKLSYPNQVWKSRINQNQWKERNFTYDLSGGRKQHYTMKFDIQNVIALKRRKKYGEQCIEDWKNYDEWKFRKDVKTLGCRPPTYIGFNTTLPKCVESKDLAKAINMTTSKNDTNPCQMIDKVIFSYVEMDGIPGVMDKLIEETNEPNENMFQLIFQFQGDTYMKVTQTKAYDLQNLVGNAGGYMGLFLGVALIQLPPLLFGTVFSAYKMFQMK